MAHLGNDLVRRSLDELRQRMPPGWTVEQRRGRSSSPAAEVDAHATIVSPDRRRLTVAIEAKPGLDPRSVLRGADRWAKLDKNLLVVARYLTPAVRDRLRELGLGYVDLTGNVRLSLREPGLFIDTTGAQSDPERQERPTRSLKGAKAGRIVRALCDFTPPLGVRELAGRATVDAGYASRLLRFLEKEALVDRLEPTKSSFARPAAGQRRGAVVDVHWRKLLERWAEDAPFDSRARVVTFIEPRGLASLQAKLAKSEIRFAITGSLAAARVAPFAPARLATLYVEDVELAARSLDLRETPTGANVLLAAPVDDVVFERTWTRDALRFAALPQVAADLLSGPGRSQAEADALFQRMASDEGSWRSKGEA